MKKPLSLILSLAVGLSGLIFSATPAQSQQVASVGGSISKLKEEYERLLAVERNPATPSEVREMNRNFLAERRAELSAALQKRIKALNSYYTSLAATLSDTERQAVEDSIRRLNEELRALRDSESGTPAGAISNSTARPANAQRSDVAATDPIEILSPRADRVVHVSEVEVEISINDELIDDLMVAVYTPAGAKPVSARVLNVKRSDRGMKSVVVALRRGDNRIEISDLKRPEVKAERKLTFTPPDTVSVGRTSAAAVTASTQANENENIENLIRGGFIGYALGGVVMSQQAQNFNQADPWLGFTAGYNSVTYNPFTPDQTPSGKAWRWQLRFQGVFQSNARAAEAMDTTNGNGNGNGNGPPADTFKFIASRKTFDVETHGAIEFFAMWPFSIGPYFSWGASTVLDRNEMTGEAIGLDTTGDGGADRVTTSAASDNDLKQYRELGLIINIRRNNRIFLQSIVARGNYEALKDLDRNGDNDDTRKRFIGKLRIFPKGLGLSLGNGVFEPVLGVEINAGTGPDQTKFFTGFVADISRFGN